MTSTDTNEMPLSQFASSWTSKAGELHTTLMQEVLRLGKISRSPEAHLPRLVELRVISQNDSDQLAKMLALTQGEKALDVTQLEQLREAIGKNSSPSLVALAIAGVISDSAKAHNTQLAITPDSTGSVVAYDAGGAVFGGICGAIGGDMVGGTYGAVAGGCFGAVLVGALASAHEGHLI
jgi:hypothetical protein